jgi:CRP-like cAMP-binding protein
MENTHCIDLLSRVELFSGLDSETLERLAAYFEPVTFQAGAEVCRRGDMPDGLYVVTDGRFGVYGEAREEGVEPDLGTLAPGDFFGEMALLAGQTRAATVRALDDGTLARLSTPRFDELIQHEPAVAKSIAAALVRRLSDSYTQLEEKVTERTQELQEALQRQMAISDVLKLLSRSAFDLKTVMRLCLESAVRFCDAQFGLIYRQGTANLELVALYALDVQLERIIRQSGTRLEAGTFASWIQEQGAVMNLANIDDGIVFDERLAALCKNIDLKAALGVPLVQAGAGISLDPSDPLSLPSGVLTIFRTQEGAFGAAQVELAETFADQAAIAIENMRLLTEVRQKTREVQQLRIEIDQAMRQKQVSEITGSDTFAEIQRKAQAMREKRRKSSGRPASLFSRVGRPPNS